MPPLSIFSVGGGLSCCLSALPLFNLESCPGRYLSCGHGHCSLPYVSSMRLEHGQVGQLLQGHLRDSLKFPRLNLIHPPVVILSTHRKSAL